MEDKAVALAKKKRQQEAQVPAVDSDDFVDLQIQEDPSLGEQLSKVRAALLM